MARSFTEREKENIKRNLKKACEQSWTQYGYKKTSVDDFFVRFYVLYRNKFTMQLTGLLKRKEINLVLRMH